MGKSLMLGAMFLLLCGWVSAQNKEPQPTFHQSGRLEKIVQDDSVTWLLHSDAGAAQLVIDRIKIPPGNEVDVVGRLETTSKDSKYPRVTVESIRIIRGERDMVGEVNYLPDQNGGMWVMAYEGATYHLSGDMTGILVGDLVRVRGNTVAMGPT